MASGFGHNRSRDMKFPTPSPCHLYEMQFRHRKHITTVLDADKRYKDLAEMMGCNNDEIRLLDLALLQQKSPSEEALRYWDNKMQTTTDLFLLLIKMKHYRTADFLLENGYVEKEYHNVLEDALSKLEELHEQNIEPSKKSFKKSASFKQPIEDTENFNQSPLNNCAAIEDNTREKKTNYERETRHLAKEFATGLNIPVQNTDVHVHKKNSSDKSSIAYKTYNALPIQNTDYSVCATGNSRQVSQESSECDNSKQPENSSTSQSSVSQLDSQQTNLSCYSQNPSGTSSLVGTIDTACGLNTQMIPYADIQASTQNFSASLILGHGGFGTVYKGNWKNTTVAIKRMQLTGRFSMKNQMKQPSTELRTLLFYCHENILSLYGYSCDGPEPCLVYQYLVNGSVEDRLECKGGSAVLSWQQRSDIARGSARGLQYLHTSTPPLVHGDIKSANILLDRHMMPKIGDFGLATEGPCNGQTHVKATQIHGSAAYLPPEYMRSQKHSFQMDTYSFGIVCFELASGRKAYAVSRGPDSAYLIEYISNMLKESKAMLIWDRKLMPIQAEWQDFFSSLIKIGIKCTERRKKDRPDMSQVLHTLEQMDIRQKLRTAELTPVEELLNSTVSTAAPSTSTALPSESTDDCVNFHPKVTSTK